MERLKFLSKEEVQAMHEATLKDLARSRCDLDTQTQPGYFARRRLHDERQSRLLSS